MLNSQESGHLCQEIRLEGKNRKLIGLQYILCSNLGAGSMDVFTLRIFIKVILQMCFWYAFIIQLGIFKK